MLKQCRVCSENKAIEDFPIGKKNRNGYRNECKSCYAAYYREYYRKNPERYKKKSREQKNYKRHGLTDSQYEYLLELHNGMCHLCLDKKATVVDHDHNCCAQRSCGKCVRGLLCSGCNTAIGMLRENIDTIHRIEEYVKRRIGEQASRHSSKVQ